MANTISFTRKPSDLDALSDSELLSTLAWSRDVPRAVVKTLRDGDHEGFVRERQSELVSRGKNDSSKTPDLQPVLWSSDVLNTTKRTEKLLAILGDFHLLDRKAGRNGTAHKSAAQINKELRRQIEHEKSFSVCELLCVLELLVAAPHWLAEDVFHSLWVLGLRNSLDVSTQITEGEQESGSADERLKWYGELRWRIGLVYGTVTGANGVLRAGAAEVQRQLLEYTDTDGTPFAALVPHLPLWIASMTRCLLLSHRFGRQLWNEDAIDRYRMLVAMATTYLSAQGRIAFNENSALSVLESAARAAGFDRTDAPRKLVRHLRRQENGDVSSKKIRGEQRPSGQSDWAHVAALRADWSVHSSQATLLHHGTLPQIFATANGAELLNGTWDLELTISGRKKAFSADWFCICWHSDRDVDYAELQLELDADTRLDRQVLLHRNRGMLFLADVITSKPNAAIAYRARLPLVQQCQIRNDTESRECQLKLAEQTVRVFPLGLPQDRIESAAGGLNPADGQLELEMQGKGGLYAPLVLYWDERGRKDAVDWNRLTVTESRSILDSSLSGAVRLRIGRRQWMAYRRIKESNALQTVLGLHTAHETVIGKFSKSGEIEPLLLIE